MNRASPAPLEESAPSRCKSCHSSRLIHHYEHGEVVCADCGVVDEDHLIDHGQDWRSFDPESAARKARTGAPSSVLLPDKGLSTTIGWKDSDHYGHAVPGHSKAQFYRLRKLQRRMRTVNATERNLSHALGEVERLSGALGLPRNVRATAAMTYRKAVFNNLVRGRTIEGIAAACVYSAARQSNLPRTLTEVAAQTRLDRTELGRLYRFVARELCTRTLPTDPQDYVKRYAADLRLSRPTEKRAMALLKDVMRLQLNSGCGPTGVAAATLYIAAMQTGEKRTQKQIASIAHVTEVTIRGRYKAIMDRLELPSPAA